MFSNQVISVLQAEIFPLWSLNDKAHGGFGFTVRTIDCLIYALTSPQQTEIGEVILMAAPFQIASQAFVFPWLADQIGYKHMMQVACGVLLCTINITPFMSQMTPDPQITHVNRTVTALVCPSEGKAFD